MRKILIATFSTGMLLAAGSASALTATSTFNVSATVLKNCLVSSADLGFGNYTPNGGDKTSSSNITVRCTKTTPYTVALNVGAAANVTAGSTYGQRVLVSGANTLQYNLYTTNTYLTVFGDGTGSTGAPSGTGNGLSAGSAITHTVYGQLIDSATNQDAAPGSYTDTITVTVTY